MSEFVPRSEVGRSEVGRSEVGGLRPVERRMRRLASQGLDAAEIGSRFKRSAEHVERVLELTRLPGRRNVGSDGLAEGRLRPLERRLLRWQAEGVAPEVLADQFRRSPDHIRRVLVLADDRRARTA